jgi:superfamily II DNA or RNA helicase
MRQPSPPCLLRAPTGSGKTFVISQVLERVRAQGEVVGFWFVPFVTLVGQILDNLLINALGLSPALGRRRRQVGRHGGFESAKNATIFIATYAISARATGQIDLYVDICRQIHHPCLIA